jgi:hypothetical protein
MRCISCALSPAALSAAPDTSRLSAISAGFSPAGLLARSLSLASNRAAASPKVSIRSCLLPLFMSSNMNERTDKVLEIDPKSLSGGDKKMSDVAFAQNLFREAFPASRYGKASAAILAAYRFLKPRVEPRIEREFTLRRARSLHEGSVRRVDGAELEALKQAQIEEHKREQRELRDRLLRLDAALAVVDEAFHGETRAAIQSQVRGFRGLDSRTGTEG